jgi:hypothetical protein
MSVMSKADLAFDMAAQPQNKGKRCKSNAVGRWRSSVSIGQQRGWSREGWHILGGRYPV